MAVSPAVRDASFTRASSTAAGSTANLTPAACSIAARAALAEARITRSGVDAMPPHQQSVNRRGGLLDRAAGHIDDRPVILREDPPRLAHLVTHRFDVGVVGCVVVIEQAEPVAAQVDQPLRI